MNSVQSSKDPFGPDSNINLSIDQLDLNESTDMENSEEFEVESILNHKNNRKGLRFLVRWKGYGPKHDLWIEESCLSNCPHLLREYKEKKNL